MSNPNIDLLYGYCTNTLEQNKTKIIRLTERKDTLNNSIHDMKSQIENFIRVESIYKQAVDILYNNSFNDLENKLNAFLNRVFDDCNYKIFLTPETQRGSKTVNIEFQSGDIISIPSDFGGSFETIIGLAFRIIYVLQTGYPVIFLDETLRDINDTYVYKLLNFLKEIGKEFGISFVIITHNDKIASLGDTHYEVFNKTYNKV